MLLTSVVMVAADKDAPFRPKAASDYEAKANFDQVVIAIEPFDMEEETQTAFGKLFPPKYGVLPVLLVIENNRKAPLEVKNLRVTYRPRGEREIDALPASDVKYAGSGPTRPKMPGTTPYPIPLPNRKKKGPLANEVIEERAFAAKMIAPGESASGFIYFLTEYHGGATITVAGLRDSTTGKDLFFTEIPITHR